MSRLKELRKSRGLTQAQLAKELQTSQQTISGIEANNELVPTDIVIKASKYFNVSVDYILELSDDKHNQVCEERMYHYLIEHEDLLLEYTALKPEYRAAVKNVVKTLSDAQTADEQQKK